MISSKEVEPEIQDLIASLEAGTGDEQETSSDVALARMLQMQYDKEHNQIIKARESKYNGTNKGKTWRNTYGSSR